MARRSASESSHFQLPHSHPHLPLLAARIARTPPLHGGESFTYKTNDGALDNNAATVSIAVGTRLLARQNLDSNIVNSDSGVLLASGGLQLKEAITPDQTLVYRSNSLAIPIIAVETLLITGVGALGTLHFPDLRLQLLKVLCPQRTRPNVHYVPNVLYLNGGNEI